MSGNLALELSHLCHPLDRVEIDNNLYSSFYFNNALDSPLTYVE